MRGKIFFLVLFIMLYALVSTDCFQCLQYVQIDPDDDEDEDTYGIDPNYQEDHQGNIFGSGSHFGYAPLPTFYMP